MAATEAGMTNLALREEVEEEEGGRPSTMEQGAQNDAVAVTADAVSASASASASDIADVVAKGEKAATVSGAAAAEADLLKGKANEMFKAEKFNGAIELYSQAIELNPVSAVLHANRSIANLRVENFGYALSDANRAIELDKTYLKGYYRRAAAHMALGKYKLALKDYERVYKVRPNDKDAKAKFTECKKIVQQIAFQRAIRVEETVVSVADTINIEAMAVEEGYDGPR